MNRCATLCGFAVAAIAVAATAADPPTKQLDSGVVTIPLDQVWAYQIEGTRDVGALEVKAPNYAYGPLLGKIRESLAKTPSQGKTADAAFAVTGTGIDSLRNANAVLTAGKKPQQIFAAENEVTVVFFTHESSEYVQLLPIERQDRIITIRYRFVPHDSMDGAEHLALIPFGKLKPGRYSVKILRSPMEQKYVDRGFQPVSDSYARRVICRSFSFSVKEQGE